ncbi:MAG: glycosyltransferase [Sphingobacteriales bacterium]|nr:glycosyltransferase [Sphingobacteriales bacterium]
MKKISLIIPVYNEAENIQPLCDKLNLYCREAYEIILVDDGSTDDTLAIIEKGKGSFLKRYF